MILEVEMEGEETEELYKISSDGSAAAGDLNGDEIRGERYRSFERLYGRATGT